MPRAIQLAALGQEYGVIKSNDHVHDRLGDVRLHRLTAISGGAVTQLSIHVIVPRPDGAVLLQGIVTALRGMRVTTRAELLHAGHGLAVVKVVGRHGAVHIVVLQRTVGEDVDAIFDIAVYRKVVHIGEVQLLGGHVTVAPAPEGPVAEPGVIRTFIVIIYEILYVLHPGGRRRIGDADHQLGGQIGAHKGGAEGGGAVLMLDELAIGTHLANVWVGGLPCDIPLGGGGRGKGQLQVIVRLLHGGDVEALRKGNALRRLHHSDGDGGDVPDAGGGVHELFKAGNAGADKGGVQLAAEAAGKLDHDLVAGVETVVAGEFLREGQIVGDGQGVVLVQRGCAAGGGLHRVRFDVAGDGQLRAGQADGRRVLVGDALTAGGGVGVGGGRRIGDGGRFRAGEDVRPRQQAGELHCRGQHDH